MKNPIEQAIAQLEDRVREIDNEKGELQLAIRLLRKHDGQDVKAAPEEPKPMKVRAVKGAKPAKTDKTAKEDVRRHNINAAIIRTLKTEGRSLTTVELVEAINQSDAELLRGMKRPAMTVAMVCKHSGEIQWDGTVASL